MQQPVYPVTKYELPSALIQAIITYNHNRQLTEYAGFVISLGHSAFRFGRAIMSKAYMETLCNGQPLTVHLELYRFRKFDLL